MKISIVTSNISADFLRPAGVPEWEERKLPYVHILRSAVPDIIGLQEVTPRQFEFLQEQLPEFTALTVPVENPAPDLSIAWQEKYGKYGFPEIPSPYEIILFYRREAFVCLSTGHWWLSSTPDVPSIGFGNIAPRVVLWAHLHHATSNRKLVIFNTHIDHRCISPMIDVCRRKFATFAGTYPSSFFIGDMNFNETDPNYGLLVRDGWKDSHDVSGSDHSGTFPYVRSELPAGRIDHVLYSGHEFAPLRWSRLSPPASHPRISDHDPVCVEFGIA
jgi:endonuclease/exonuclease/phosphatase family metal-dependent hydrolase